MPNFKKRTLALILMFALVITMMPTTIVTKASEGDDPYSLMADQLAEGEIADELKVGIFTIKGLVEVDGNNKEAADGTLFTRRIKLGGSGSSTSRSIHFKSEGKAEVTVYAMSSSSSAERHLALYSSDGEIDRMVAPGPDLGMRTFTVEAGEYYLASPASGVNVYGVVFVDKTPQEQVFFLNADDVTIESITENLKVNAFTIKATEANKVDVDNNSKKAPDGTEFARRIKLGGSGDPEYRSIHFNATAGSTVTVYAMSSSSSAERHLALYSLDGTEIDRMNAPGASLGENTFVIDEAGDYYVASPSSGVNVYGIRLVIPVPDAEVVSIQPLETIINKIGSIELPEQVDANLDTGGTKTIFNGIEWHTEEIIFTVGTHTVPGTVTVDGKTFEIEVEVTVMGIEEIAPLEDITIEEGRILYLPTEVTVTYSDGETTDNVEVTWDMEDIDLTVGDHEIEGTIENFDGKAKITVNVIERQPRIWQFNAFGGNTSTAEETLRNPDPVINLNDGTITMVATGGKIANGDEGISFYSKEIDIEEDFKLSARATVVSYNTTGTISNSGQKSFGLMLRDGLRKDNADQAANYVAVGVLGTNNANPNEARPFYKSNAVGAPNYPTTGTPNSLVRLSAMDLRIPEAGTVYDFSIEKFDDTYILTINGESEIITLEDLFTETLMAGIYVARDAEVTFSNLRLDIYEPIELVEEWEFRAFGDNTNISERNFDPVINQDGSVTIEATGGKISSNVDGISFYFKEVPTRANFEIKAKAELHNFTANNQVSFGLMLRDSVGVHGVSSGHESNYVAVGALDQVMRSFTKQNLQQVKGDIFESPVTVDDTYELSIKKAGDTYVLTINGETQVMTIPNNFDDNMYVGIYTARGAKVTFSEFDIIVDNRKVSTLEVDGSAMKTDYLVGESLDPTGLVVKAIFQDETEEVLLPSNYIITGFDSSSVGVNTITINYNGRTTTLDLNIVPLTVTDMDIRYSPAKTEYYIGDEFNPLGLTITATYNEGYKVADLSDDQYSLYIDDVEVTDENPIIFATGGTKAVKVVSLETPEVFITFNVEVLDANITGIEIRTIPEKDQYFLGDELDISGIVVFAKYSNDTELRLLRNEFTVTGFDSATVGDKVLTVTHKGQTATFTVNVKERESTELVVTGYPKTTYFIGESFDSTGIKVSKLFDNGELEEFTAYTLDISEFDNTTAGVYEIGIISSDSNIDATVLEVTVREEVSYEWKEIVFGQSSGSARNSIEVINEDHIKLIALEGGGKITGDQDGISFYYVELDANEDNFSLAADIKVIEYAKTPHDGQEAFGIMARDAIGEHLNASVFSSNIAAVGGHSGGTGLPNGTQLFVRTGVLNPDGEGSQGLQRRMIEQVRPTPATTASNYRLTLSKTNSGFTGQLNNGEEVIIFEPEVLSYQNDTMYVGFFVARLATIEVTNIDLEVTAAATDAPREYPALEPVNPGIRVESLNRVSETAYNLILDANVDGTATVRKGNDIIFSNVAVKGGEFLELQTTVNDNAMTNFSISFIPDDTQYLTSYDLIVRNFSVDMRTYQEGANIYVSPTGTSAGDGSRDNPLDIHTAIDFVQPGQTIIALEGQYLLSRRIEINKYNDGRDGEMKKLFAEEGKQVIFDADRRVGGVRASGNWWHIKGIDFARSAGNSHGFRLGGSHNIIELCNFYENGETGLQISRNDGSMNIEDWPSYNLILNSTSYFNRDPAENNADGFAAKLTSGYGNVFDGCISYNNIDDGWDLYTKVGEGAIGPVIIRNSVAFNNGYRQDGSSSGGHGIGFKLGGEGVRVPHIIENSIAFGNKAVGFSSNSNPDVIVQGQNIGFNNHGSNLDLRTYPGVPGRFSLEGFISFHYNNPKQDADSNQSLGLISDSTFLWDGSKSVNASGVELTINNFSALEMPERVNRLADGSIDWSFLTYDPSGSFDHTLPEDPSEPSEPIETPDGAVFFESFVGATADSLWTPGYRAFPTDSTKAMYIRKSGASSVSIENDSITLINGRFTIGADSSTDSNSETRPNGVLDLSKPYQIIIDITKSEGAGALVVYVDNNTAGMNNSPLGGASKVFDEPTSEVPVGLLVIEQEVGTDASFIQIRTSGSGIVTINSVTIKYLDDDTEEPVDPIDFEVNNVMFTNYAGNEVTELIASSDIVVKADITNVSEEAKEATLIVALYNADNTMVNYARVQWTAEVDENRTLEAGFKLPENVDGYKVKAFIWDSLQGMRAISNVEILE
ncbi:Ig-like protein group 3 [Natranaerovirga pectinivora]|uniref:Ig-like protein group 3 n=1 Tax=Natranaerovirga pectinivora TaxID=682400 RepID=A0A4R3MLA6_9FIRM|nr:bacterial Ig-like domain-containing protein [Natranaerovirga pectinivora]TCT15472.1 Ig-like protein group 3 [Natranaerovirga pectinivora]